MQGGDGPLEAGLKERANGSFVFIEIFIAEEVSFIYMLSQYYTI